MKVEKIRLRATRKRFFARSPENAGYDAQSWARFAPLFFTWLGLFCMWLYFPVASVMHNVFGAHDPNSPTQGKPEWNGVEFVFAAYSAVALLCVLFRLAWLSQTSGKEVYPHHLSSRCGAVGLMSVAFMHNKYMLLLTMLGVGNCLGQQSLHAVCRARGLVAARENGRLYGHLQFLRGHARDSGVALLRGWIMIHFLQNNRMRLCHYRGRRLHAGDAAALMQRVKDPRTLSIRDL